jgi:hypothetical protein
MSNPNRKGSVASPRQYRREQGSRRHQHGRRRVENRQRRAGRVTQFLRPFP